MIKNLLHKVLEIAEKEKAEKVIGVKVKMGALSHISAEHFRGHFEEGTAGTIVEGARLDIETSQDLNDPQAQDILLLNVEVEKG